MRKNYPITEVETKVHPNQYLISKTDLKGRITYANSAFVDISGFTRTELLGKAHNIVRHPHMPPAGFQDLWDTLQANKPWLGLVKNRRQDGGFYWVQALVSPIFENGHVTGYASVRVRPSDAQVAEAEHFYEQITNNEVSGYTLKAGRIVPTGWRRVLQWARWPFNRSLRASMFRLTMLATVITGTISVAAFNQGIPEGYQLAAGLFLGAGFSAFMAYGWHISQRVNKALKSASQITQQIAAGNLDLHISDAEDAKTQNHETGELNFCLEIMRKSLIAIAADTHRGVLASIEVAKELDHDNRLLSERTAHQADSLQKTAASMEELTVTVKQNADNAVRASELANNSMQTAKRGGTAVAELTETMQGIHSSANQISEIVSLIEGIAFQTNILALNAAVESARAGEAGRGFAVVAGEVRSLAQRSSKAAGEIKLLINESVTLMNEGVQKADHAAQTMHDIEESVQRVSDIINEISYASEEQSIGLQQINQAVSHMDEVTRQNGFLVDDLGRTTQQLSHQASELDESIRVLNTEATRQTPAIEHSSRARLQ